jgi:16S rRNA (guanine966-N2)-methyltransferase
MDVRRAPTAKESASLVFFDPPYHKGLIEAALDILTQQGWIAPRALLVCETAKAETLTLPDNNKLLLHKTYGDTSVWFFEWVEKGK